jgi:glycosyltransferase involved in cell wall biosynthesis
MKSVCIVVQNNYEFDPRVRRKAEALVAAGYCVDVLALRSPHAKKAYTLNGVNVYTLSLGKKRGSLARYLFEYVAFFLWAFVRVTLQMRRKRYAIIDVNTLPDLLIFASIFAKRGGAKVVLDMHEITPEFYMSKYGAAEGSWLARLLKHLERISFNFADHVTTVNEPIRGLLVGRGLPHSKSTVIMNAVDEKFFAESSCFPTVSDAAAAPRRFVMMYHGTLSKIYGLEVAIEAFGMAHEQMPGAELWILGNGPEKGALEGLTQQCGLASKVRFVGLVSPTEVPAWLNRCDIGILPMRRDVFLDFAFPNKLSEYIIMGKPVVVPGLKAIRHYFSEEALAYFEPNNRADLAGQMVRVYRDSKLRAQLADRAKEEYAPIRWDVMKQRYLRLMEDMVGSGGRTAGLPRADEMTILPR